MKIETLRISNFRGIQEVSLSDLGNMVIIAGQNGSGKSCLFDAIRLLKSVYGGYQQNEWQQWMGEFQIQISNRSSDFGSMFNSRSRELRITCEFRLSEEERSYIHAHADELLREQLWKVLLPEAYTWGSYRSAMFATQIREREPEVAERAKKAYPALMQELAATTIRGECFVIPGDTLRLINSVALSVIFSTFRPKEIGVIDYHGAQRHYGRELVQGINLSLDGNEQQRSHTALYNYANKYNNVKSEMAASYVKEILAEQAGVPRASQSTLTNTLKELFANFFPDKTFLGPTPTPNGGLEFPVKTASGNLHDLDELSAGEKEILYGYLRIRNSAPRHSIILLDEPELHLNPRLIRGLPQFYQKHLGEALGNQIWLVTHSDALLREVVGRTNYNVFHMLPCGGFTNTESQLKPLAATADLELALIDLVGDLASYRPGGKVVIFEGGGDSDFDQWVTRSLFPEILGGANLISATNKSKVRALHEILERASKKGQLPFQFFSIADRDSGFEATAISSQNAHTWDVYHIENYFIEPKYILKVLAALGIATLPSEEEVFDELRECAKETLPQLVRHELSSYANAALVKSINTSLDPRADDLVDKILDAIQQSVDRINTVQAENLNKARLVAKRDESIAKYQESIANGTWVQTFRGRDILKRFAGKRAPSVTYEVFRNLVLSQMRDDGFRPHGMAVVVQNILSK